MGKAGQITQRTLIPVGIAAALILGAYRFGADRQKALAGIEANAVKIKQTDEKVRDLEEVLADLADSMHRVEIHLGTLPKGGGQP